MSEKRKFIGGSKVYKQLNSSGWDASAYASAIEKQKKEESKDTVFGSNGKKAAAVQKNKDFWGVLGDIGGAIVGGVQQAAGHVGDVVLQGGAIVDEFGNQIQGGTEQDKAKRRVKNIESTEKLRKGIHETKDVTGKKLAGTSSADEAATKVATGRGNLNDIAKVSLTGLETGADVMMFANPATGIAKSAAGMTGKAIAKDVANNAILGAVSGGASAGANDEDIVSGAMAGAAGGALLSGAGNVIGKGIGKLASKGKKVDETLTTAKPTTEAITPETTIAESKLLEAPISEQKLLEAPTSARPLQEVERRLNEVQTGTGEYANATPSERMNEFKKLREELQTAKSNSENTNFTMPSRTYDEVSNEIDALGAGGVAPEAVVQRADFKDVDEVLDTPKLPQQIRARAASLKAESMEVEKQLKTLMTPQKAKPILDKATDDYNAEIERINNFPEPLRTEEMERVQSEFSNKYNKIKEQLANDSETVNELARDQEQNMGNTMEVMADANIVKNNHPTEFGEVDEQLNEQISQEVRQDTEKAIFNRMSGEEGSPDAENVSKAFTEIPADKIDDNLTSPELGDLATEALQDTFRNETFDSLNNDLISRNLNRTYTGMSLSSQNVVLENTFGREGLKVFGDIIHGYADKNIADLDASKKLAVIKEGLGGSKELYSKAVDLLEGKNPDLTGLNSKQLDAMQKVVELRDMATRLVQKAAYNEKKASFDKRYASNDVKYTTSEIKQLAKRDGTTIKEATDKYENIDSFQNKDVEYLATLESNTSTIDNYYPHMFDEKGNEKIFTDSEYVKSSGDVKFGNMLHRYSEGDNYSRDIIDVFAQYYGGLNKKVYLEPSLRKLDDAKLVIKAADSESSPVYQWLDKYQAQLKYNKPDAIGKSFNELVDTSNKNINARIDKIQKKLSSDESSWNKMIDSALERVRPNNDKIGQNHYRTVLSTQRQVNSMAALGLSFRNAIQQLTQVGTSIGNLGTKDVLAGAGKYLSHRLNPTTKDVYLKALDSRGITNAGIAKEAYSDLFDSGVNGVIKNKGEKLGDKLMFMTQKMDEFARGSTYEASLLSHMREGMSRVDAERLATADAARFNFLTSKVDMPLKLNGDTVRSLSQFMTFSLKQAEAWKRIGIKAIKNPETGKFQLQPKEMSRLIQMVAFYGLAFEGMSQVAGIDPEDNIPFWGNLTGESGLPKSPLVSLLVGQNDSNPGLLDIVGGIVNPSGDTEFDKEQSRQDMFNKLGGLTLRNFVPAGSQMKKSVEGFNSTENEGVVSKDGKVRYIQNTDDASKLKATLFGQYSTDAGREWINKKFPTLSEKQSKILMQQKDEASKKQAYDFYAGLKSTTTKDNILSKVRDTMETQPKKAERLIKDHNAEVDNAIADYESKYGELGEQQKDYLNSEYYITVGNVEKLNEE